MDGNIDCWLDGGCLARKIANEIYGWTDAWINGWLDSCKNGSLDG